jgi:hypothetical protein
MMVMDESYRDMVIRSMEPYPGTSAKRNRAGLRADLEMWRFNRNSLRALERGGFEAMFEFQRKFNWKHDKHWRRYFG